MEEVRGLVRDRGISTVFNDVGGIYNEVRALVYQHVCHGIFVATRVSVT